MNIKLFLLFVLAGAILFAPVPTFAQQAPLFFDAFLFDNAGQPADNFNTFIQWDVTDGTVDLVGGNVPGATDQTNGRFVELGGSTNDPGVFATKVAFPFAPTTVYNLRFDYKSSDGNPNSAQVTVGSQTFTVSTSSTALQTFSRNFTFGDATTAKLIFQDLGNDNFGIGIDNVVLSTVAVQPPIFFDAFLFDNAGQPADNFNAFIQWDVTDGTVDLVGGNVPGAPDQTNGRFVELGGSTNDPGVFATKLAFPFAAGVFYNLRFDYKSSDGNPHTARASVGSQVFEVTTSSTELQTFSRSFSFPVTTNEKLIFQNVDNGNNNGIGIDNVILSLNVVTAAPVTVGGRATTVTGRGIRGAFITLTDAAGNSRTAITNPFGYYRFNDVTTGETYILTARSKSYSFAQSSQVLNVTQQTDEINFVGDNGFNSVRQ